MAAVDEGIKRWLMRNATMMIYPTIHEGFGLVPFESAELGLACAFASHTSIAELLPSSLALIEPWNADTTADRLAPYVGSTECGPSTSRPCAPPERGSRGERPPTSSPSFTGHAWTARCQSCGSLTRQATGQPWTAPRHRATCDG